MSKEEAMSTIQTMSIEDILAKGLYVVAEEVNKTIILIDVYFFKDEAKEALKLLRQFDSASSKTKLLSPSHNF